MQAPEAALEGKVGRMLARLGREAEGSPYWVYAIRDPLTGDRRDWTTGDPFFLGQTNNPVRRARAHLAAEAGLEEEPGHALRARIQAILRQGRAPVFDLIEPAPTRLAALAAERRWAARLRAEGFDIATAWEGDDTEFGTTGVSLDRVWTLTLAEAGEAGLGLGIGCEACGLELALPLDGLVARSTPATRLGAVREALHCPNCGRGEVLHLTPPG